MKKTDLIANATAGLSILSGVCFIITTTISLKDAWDNGAPERERRKAERAEKKRIKKEEKKPKKEEEEE